jgi:flagellar protein FliJ
MKKFAYRLQRVLDLRAAQEQVRLAEFGREQQALIKEQQKLDVFRGEEALQMQEARSERHAPFSIWSQTLDCRYLHRISRVIDYQTGRVEKQKQAVDGARTVYLDAHKETRVLEILREKKLDEWKVDSIRDEYNVLDEVSSRKTGDEELCSTRSC